LTPLRVPRRRSVRADIFASRRSQQQASLKLALGKEALFHLPIEWSSAMLGAGLGGGRLPKGLVNFARVLASLDKHEMLRKVGTAFDSSAPAIAHTAIGRA
jgi:hypothetical protein